MRSLITFALVAGLALGNAASIRADEKADLLKELERLNKNMDYLKNKLDKMEDDLKTESVRGASSSTQLRELNERMTQLERQVADIVNSRGSTTVRRYYDPRNRSDYLTPGNRDVVPAPAAGGVVHLENRYSVPVTVYINGRAQPLGAFQRLNVEGVPAGVFTYEVMAEGFGLIQQTTARTLPPGGSHNIYINPPAVAALP
jgi:hypothetical protein